MKIILTVGKQAYDIPAWLFWPWLGVQCYIGLRYVITDLWKILMVVAGG